ncbi:hypothetical protein Pcinc_024010 [Petrolisthes cinctipes]|uniref:G-protein coupled receptors family 1 profile domain-containing protein n=1 Tax=Petrolisthes cinctipes TaxID=88211 RepID=A0AAE1KFZ7_PETCI|nr:hypothetical protein Pcinc_024010 [Petrolisthes cinctipes]
MTACQESYPVGGPGATIVSPLLLSVTGLIGQICALFYLHSASCTSSRSTLASSNSISRCQPKHSTHFHTFLLALIWTDLIGKITTSIPPINAYAHGCWVGGKEMCNYHGFSMVLCCLVTHATVTAMAVERFFGICHSCLHRTYITTARCRYVISGIWIFSIAFSLLPLLGVGEFYLQYPNSWCFVNLHLCPSTPLQHRFYTISIGVFNLVTNIIMVVCNVLVVGSLLKLRRASSSSSSNSTNGQQSLGAGQRWWRGQSDLELQTVVVLVIISTLFTLSWVPVDVLLLGNFFWQPHLKDSDHKFELFMVRCSSVNQIVDPWAYIICRAAFRSRVWDCCRFGLVGRWRSERPAPSHLSSPLPSIPPPPHLSSPSNVASYKGQHQKQQQLTSPSPPATVSIIPVHDDGPSYSGLELGDGGTHNYSHYSTLP